MLTINIGELAQYDLQNQYRYFATVSSHDLASRFFQAVRQASAFLADFSSSGSKYTTRIKKLEGIRCWPIRDFPITLSTTGFTAANSTSCGCCMVQERFRLCFKLPCSDTLPQTTKIAGNSPVPSLGCMHPTYTVLWTLPCVLHFA